jgi:predicted transglutaminase-like cysteine proteinase
MKRFVFSQTRISAISSSALFFTLWLFAAAVQAQAPEVFGYTPVPVPAQPDLAPYTKWIDMTRRLKEQKGWEDEDCTSVFATCPQKEWRKMLARAKGADPQYQLDDVNRFLNKFDYVLDAVNWGGVDYWETPREFFLKGGECKDFSISKYFTLRILGWAPDKLWMIILQDMNLNVTHAVLAARLDDRTMILDNQVPDLVDQSRIRHYRPIFGLSEAGWVIYRPK